MNKVVLQVFISAFFFLVSPSLLMAERNQGMQDENRIFTYNLFCGLRFCGNREGLFSRMSVGMRLYHENNPYGQFRNHKNFNHFGGCIVFE